MSPDRADVRWNIRSTSGSGYTLIFVISVSCTAVHVLVRLYTVQVYRYRNTGIHRIHVQRMPDKCERPRDDEVGSSIHTAFHLVTVL